MIAPVALVALSGSPKSAHLRELAAFIAGRNDHRKVVMGYQAELAVVTDTVQSIDSRSMTLIMRISPAGQAPADMKWRIDWSNIRSIRIVKDRFMGIGVETGLKRGVPYWTRTPPDPRWIEAADDKQTIYFKTRREAEQCRSMITAVCADLGIRIQTH